MGIIPMPKSARVFDREAIGVETWSFGSAFPAEDGQLVSSSNRG